MVVDDKLESCFTNTSLTDDYHSFLHIGKKHQLEYDCIIIYFPNALQIHQNSEPFAIRKS